uniref:ARAD1B15664p n=1 Tax=Blastobotrys adeninivorans TaxID=409370 RepID=A0A060T6G6_BLAAD
MSPKVFLTGATGFIGGDFLASALKAHSDWQWSCLVRSEEKGKKVAALSPQISLCYGTIDDINLIEEEASNADIVFHSAASDDHAASAEAIVRGLKRRNRDGPAFYIHTSGAFILAHQTLSFGQFGERLDKVFDDWDGIKELVTMPYSAPHRNVDKIVLSAGSERIKTAIVAPTVVYGVGRGPDKKKWGPLFESFLKSRKVFMVGKGENIWHNIHVQDLSRLNLLLAEAAASGGGNATWNQKGYYLAENGSYVCGEMLKMAADILYRKGLVNSPDLEVVPVDQSESVDRWLKIMVGADCQGVALRARKLLGWKPVMPSFEQELEPSLESDANELGLL